MKLNFVKSTIRRGSRKPAKLQGISDCAILGKPLGLIILQRLKNYVEKNKLISQNQIGFMEEAQTSDHIFLLLTIVEKVIKKLRKTWIVYLLTSQKHTI